MFCILSLSLRRFKHNRGVAQLASALAWGARGRKFESFHPDGENQRFIRRKYSSDFFVCIQFAYISADVAFLSLFKYKHFSSNRFFD